MREYLRQPIRIAALAGLVVVLGGVVALVAWSDQPRVRYATLKCQFRAIYNERGPVDVVIVGTSRTRHGVSGEVVAGELATAEGEPVVLNVGRGFRGTQQMLQMVRDVAEERGIRGAIVVEYSREDDLDGAMQRYYDYHPEHAAMVPFDRLWGEADSTPREPSFLVARDQLARVTTRVDYALDRVITGRADRNVEVPLDERPVGGSRSCSGKDFRPKPDALARWAERSVPVGMTWRDLEPAAWALDSVNGDSQRAAIRELVALGDELGVPVYFTLMPRYLDPSVDPAFTAAFEESFGAPLLVLPPDMLERLYADGYSDPNHLYGPGREAYSRWLAQQLRER